MPREVTKHQCNYCTRAYASKYRAKQHEDECLRNPVNRSCFTCIYGTSSYCGIISRPIYQVGNAIRNCKSHENKFDFYEETEEVPF